MRRLIEVFFLDEHKKADYLTYCDPYVDVYNLLHADLIYIFIPVYIDIIWKHMFFTDI